MLVPNTPNSNRAPTEPEPRSRKTRDWTFSWHFLTPLPLAAALVGVAAITMLTLGAMTSLMRTTDHTLISLVVQSHDAGHLWVDLATQRAYTAEIVATGLASKSTLAEVEHATADAHRRLVSFAHGPTGGEHPDTYSEVLRTDQAALPMEQQLLHAIATGHAARAQDIWFQLNPSLSLAEVDAHRLWHETYDSFPRQVASVMGMGIRVHRQLQIAAFALVGAGFAVISLWAGRTVAQPLRRLDEAASAIREGDLTVRLPHFHIREFNTLAVGFNTMAQSLDRMRTDAEKVHQQALALREGQAALAQHRLGLVVQAQEEERRRLAQDLHDETSQALTAILLSLERMAHDLPQPALPQVHALESLVRQTMTAVRNIAIDLHPPVLDEMGLVPALQEWLDHFSLRVPLPVMFICDASMPRLSRTVETALFRIVQEAVTNAVRHARQAHAVHVELRVDEARVFLQIVDDGLGFVRRQAAGEPARRGLGLIGMQERARQIGGTMEVVPATPRGTVVRLTVPLHQRPLADPPCKLAEGATVGGVDPLYQLPLADPACLGEPVAIQNEGGGHRDHPGTGG